MESAMPYKSDAANNLQAVGCGLCALPFAILFGILLLVFVYAMGRTLLGI
jgi:hypothetical protein